MQLNRHYQELEQSYLFTRISREVTAFQKAHPNQNIIRLGIGDVTLPLCPAVVEALQTASAELGKKETFRGYGPEQGYDFLRKELQGYYAEKGVSLDADEIFVSDGAKSDLGNILDLFSADNTVLIPDPVYPVYVDTNTMAGRKIQYMDATEQNGFLPLPDSEATADIIYLCSPNNPTGAVYNREQLQKWVDYANKLDAVILFDAAYEAFITEPGLPRSIYEIEGAKTCAIEFSSLSKTAGFTGTRCGYTTVPKALMRDGAALGDLWLRRQTTKFNGVPYIVQRGAAAVFSPEGRLQTAQNIAYYQENAAILAGTLKQLGISYAGGKNSPYIWMKCPRGMKSWDFFDHLLTKAGIVGTPGAGFGKNGEGYFRLTAFGGRKSTMEAAERLKALLQ